MRIIPLNVTTSSLKAIVLPVCVSAEPYAFSFVFLLWDSEKHQHQRHRWQSLGSLTTSQSSVLNNRRSPTIPLKHLHKRFPFIYPHYPTIPCPWVLSRGTNAAGASPESWHWPLTPNPLHPPQPSISPFFMNLNTAVTCCWGIPTGHTGFAHISFYWHQWYLLGQAGNHWGMYIRDAETVSAVFDNRTSNRR